jgi:O-antigen/teichoic acid export membrane protein
MIDNTGTIKSEQRYTPEKMNSGRTLSRNMAWNLLGMGLPTLIALAAIPALIQLMGKERFGVLLLAWLVFGYMSIFDFGLHRALTQLVSKALGQKRQQDVAPLFWTALLLTFAAGMVGAVLVGFLSETLVHEWLKVPEDLLKETHWAFLVMALSLPLLVSTSALRGFVEAHQRFGMIFVVQIWRGVWTFASPLLIVGLITPNLFVVVLGLLLGRAVAWALLMGMCLYVQPKLWHAVCPRLEVVKPLLTYGGWVALAHMVVPIVLYGDRMIIGGFISMEGVTYYTTPAEMVIKLLLVPQALVGVLFPAFASTYTIDLAHTQRLFQLGMKLIYLIFLPIAILGVALAPEALWLWLGSAFLQHSSFILQVLIIGVFLNGFGVLFASLVQGMGRPSIPALLYCAELPVFGALVCWLTWRYGIEGTAVAWALRQAVDALLLLFLTRMVLKDQSLRMLSQMSMGVFAVLMLAMLIALDGLVPRLLMAGLMLILLFIISWTIMFSESERNKINSLLRLNMFPAT